MNGHLRILHLEDSKIDAELIAAKLEEDGLNCTIDWVDAKDDYSARLEQGGFDLILADYTLPSFDGLSALQMTRVRYPGVPFIFVSGTIGEDRAVETFKSGATDYVLKGHLFRLVPSIRRALKDNEERNERRHAEESLRESEARYRALFDNNLDAVLLTLPDGIILAANRAACRIFGMSEAEICATGRNGLVDAADPRLIVLLEERARIGIASGELTLIRKGGAKFPGEVSSALFKDKDGHTKSSMVIRDITERKQKEDELQRLNRTLVARSKSSKALMSAGNESWYLNEVCRIIVEDCGHDLVWIGYVEQDEDRTVRPVAHAGFEDGYLASMKITWSDSERGRGPVGTAIRTGKPSVVRNLLSDPVFAPWREEAVKRGYAAVIGVPLLADGKAFGSLNIYSGHEDPFSKDEVQLLNDLAADLSFGIAAIRQRTAQADAESALRESEAQYRHLFDNMLEGYAYCKMLYVEDALQDIVFIQVNDAFEKLTGLKDVVEKKVSEVIPGIHESNPELLRILGRAALTGKPERFEIYSESFGGWLDISVYSHEKEHVIAVFDNITERKRAERYLAEKEARLRLLVETIPDMIWLKDVDGRYLSCNKMFEQFFGAKESDIVGKTDYDFVIKELADFFRDHDRKAMAEGKPSSTVEWITFACDGHRTLMNTIKTPMYDAANNLIGVLGIARDITEYQKLEEQLRHAQKLEGIGTLAGGIAHDFNNILSAIIGYGHITLMKMPKDDPLRMNIEHILESAERAAALTQSLLAFSRKQITNRQPVELNSVLKKMQKFLVRIIGEDVAIRLALVEGALTIFADAGQLEQVFMNFATNARDAMPNGGSFTIETSIRELDSGFVNAHGYGQEGTYAMISATDTGIGMTEETKLKIFEPFFTTKEVGKGTGLGLAMVYGILKQHEGFINVYSEPGKGTTFRIYLPLIKAEAVEEQMTIAAEYPKGGTETVLVAEDDASLRKLTLLVLEQMGYTVIIANDGEEAVTKFMENKDRIQLLLFDIIMPKKNGKEAYEEIRKVMPNIPVLFATGYSSDMLSDKALIEKGAAIVYKPISPLDLSKKVREVLDRKRY